MNWFVIGLTLASAFASAMSTTLKKAAANRSARSSRPALGSQVWAAPCGSPASAST